MNRKLLSKKFLENLIFQDDRIDSSQVIYQLIKYLIKNKDQLLTAPLIKTVIELWCEAVEKLIKDYEPLPHNQFSKTFYLLNDAMLLLSAEDFDSHIQLPLLQRLISIHSIDLGKNTPYCYQYKVSIPIDTYYEKMRSLILNLVKQQDSADSPLITTLLPWLTKQKNNHINWHISLLVHCFKLTAPQHRMPLLQQMITIYNQCRGNCILERGFYDAMNGLNGVIFSDEERQLLIEVLTEKHDDIFINQNNFSAIEIETPEFEFNSNYFETKPLLQHLLEQSTVTDRQSLISQCVEILDSNMRSCYQLALFRLQYLATLSIEYSEIKKLSKIFISQLPKPELRFEAKIGLLLLLKKASGELKYSIIENLMTTETRLNRQSENFLENYPRYLSLLQQADGLATIEPVIQQLDLSTSVDRENYTNLIAILSFYAKSNTTCRDDEWLVHYFLQGLQHGNNHCQLFALQGLYRLSTKNLSYRQVNRIVSGLLALVNRNEDWIDSCINICSVLTSYLPKIVKHNLHIAIVPALLDTIDVLFIRKDYKQFIEAQSLNPALLNLFLALIKIPLTVASSNRILDHVEWLFTQAENHHRLLCFEIFDMLQQYSQHQTVCQRIQRLLDDDKHTQACSSAEVTSEQSLWDTLNEHQLTTLKLLTPTYSKGTKMLTDPHCSDHDTIRFFQLNQRNRQLARENQSTIIYPASSLPTPSS